MDNPFSALSGGGPSGDPPGKPPGKPSAAPSATPSKSARRRARQRAAKAAAAASQEELASAKSPSTRGPGAVRAAAAAAPDDGFKMQKSRAKKSAAERAAARDARAAEQAAILAPHSAATQAWLTKPPQDGTRDAHGRGSAATHADEQHAKEAYLAGDPGQALHLLDRAYQARVAENKRNKSGSPETDHGAGYVLSRRNSIARVAGGSAPAAAAAAPKPASGK